MKGRGDMAQVLIVEDERIVALTTKHIVEGHGHQVVGIAASAQEALDILSQHRPTIVLMDIMLKGPVDGIELTHSINKQYDLPVLYVTAHADHVTLERLMQTQHRGVLNKPFDEADLMSAMHQALSQQQ